MVQSNSAPQTVAGILREAQYLPDAINLRQFQDFVTALSNDCGLPKKEVRSLLVEEMLRASPQLIADGNVLWLERLMNHWGGDDSFDSPLV